MSGDTLKIYDAVINPISRLPLTQPREFLIFRELNYDAVKGEFYFSRKDMRTGWPALHAEFGSIDEVIKNIDKYNVKHIKQEDPSNNESSNLAIAVRAPSYVVLSINKALPWSFGKDQKKQSISVGEDKNTGYQKNFSSVRHYNADGSVTDEVGKQCTMVAFSVDPLLDPDPHAEPYNDQPINFHLVDAGGTAITVNPDIRYPGNSGLEIDPPTIVIIPADEPQP